MDRIKMRTSARFVGTKQTVDLYGIDVVCHITRMSEMYPETAYHVAVFATDNDSDVMRRVTDEINTESSYKYDHLPAFDTIIHCSQIAA